MADSVKIACDGRTYNIVQLKVYYNIGALCHQHCIASVLEGPARYAGLLLAPAEGFGWGLKVLYTLFVLISDNFLCLVVTYITFSSNLSNFEYNPKKTKKNLKSLKFKKKIKNSKTILKNLKSLKNLHNSNKIIINKKNHKQIWKKSKI